MLSTPYVYIYLKASKTKVCRKPIKKRLVKYVAVNTKFSDSADQIFPVNFSCSIKVRSRI